MKTRYVLVNLWLKDEEEPVLILMEPESLNMLFGGVMPTNDGGFTSFTPIDPHIAIIGRMAVELNPEAGVYRVLNSNKATFLDRVSSFEVSPEYYEIDTHGYLVAAQNKEGGKD